MVSESVIQYRTNPTLTRVPGKHDFLVEMSKQLASLTVSAFM